MLLKFDDDTSRTKSWQQLVKVEKWADENGCQKNIYGIAPTTTTDSISDGWHYSRVWLDRARKFDGLVG